MRLWIDVVNAPHVRLFYRLLRSRLSDVDSVLVTVRDYGALRQLTDALISPIIEGTGEVVSVGGRGESKIEKLKLHLSRILELIDIVEKFRPDVALSKASPEMARIAFGLGIPSVVANDNDKSVYVSKLSFPLANSIVLPECFPLEVALRAGADPAAIRQFRGVFEVAHVLSHREWGPYERVDLDALGLVPREFVVFRPEPVGASYLEGALDALSYLKALLNSYDVVVFPRGERPPELHSRHRLIVVDSPIDYLDLVSKAAAFVGGGGTMTREAALLGIPSASAYPGEEPSVNVELEKAGLVWRLKSPSELPEFLKAAEDRGNWASAAFSYLARCEDPTEVIWSEALKLVSRETS
ncbi:MAG TPA: DUF354 domain-containing protein [Candidatus Korarchaeota archaeon]|nr:DUF354 domain-containing protein [Candidatus Korarchaeota archaeon]